MTETDLTRDILTLCQQHGAMIATAESCTGGMVAAALTDIAGSSAMIDRGYVTYSNAAKADMLAVDPEVIQRNGAVSEDVVRAMASGALARIDHDGPRLAVSISGIAGPTAAVLPKSLSAWSGLALPAASATGSI